MAGSPERAGPSLTRRRALGLISGGAAGLLAGCGDDREWHATNVTGSSPSLDFRMARASDGETVTAADYRGEIVLLSFGYTFCPDVCPMTLANLAAVSDMLGPEGGRVRVLFVTVDPTRDTLPILKSYVQNFGPRVEGLRGTADQIERLARRYRVVHSVTPAENGRPYEVSHSSAVYVFDASGRARLLMSSLDGADAPLGDVAADLRQVMKDESPGLLTRLWTLV